MFLFKLGLSVVVATLLAVFCLTQNTITRWITRRGHSFMPAASASKTPVPGSTACQAEDNLSSSDITPVYQKLVGAWKLVSYEVKIYGPLTFTRYPFGKHATGLILYTSDGYMSAQLMAPGAKSFTSSNYHDGSVVEMISAAQHYLAYSGSYSVDIGPNSKPLLRHSVEVSLYPNWLGTDQSRICEMSDEEMTLTSDTLPTWKGMKVEAVLKWRRSAPATTDIGSRLGTSTSSTTNISGQVLLDQ